MDGVQLVWRLASRHPRMDIFRAYPNPSVVFTLTFEILQTPRGTRLFHQIAIVVITVGCVSYFSMASNLGATPVRVEFRGLGTRQIWVRS